MPRGPVPRLEKPWRNSPEDRISREIWWRRRESNPQRSDRMFLNKVDHMGAAWLETRRAVMRFDSSRRVWVSLGESSSGQ